MALYKRIMSSNWLPSLSFLFFVSSMHAGITKIIEYRCITNRMLRCHVHTYMYILDYSLLKNEQGFFWIILSSVPIYMINSLGDDYAICILECVW